MYTKKSRRSALKHGVHRFCSKRCLGKYYSGEKSHLYKNGNTSEQDKIRKSEEYRNWRTSVFLRDGKTCQDCGYKGTDIEAHHLKPQSLFPELRFNLENGLTLCKNCHKKTPSYMNPNMAV
jgi:hypothetical protein